MTKKMSSILLTLAVILAVLVGCSGEPQLSESQPEKPHPSTEQANATEPSTHSSELSPEERLAKMDAAVLQYPSSNSEWEYNVYDCYVELTKYIGPEITDLTIPAELEGQPVLSLNCSDSIPAEVTYVTFPEGLLVIGDNVFGEYPDYAALTFRHDRKLNALVLPDSILSIGAGAFYGCEISSSSFSLPQSLLFIGDDAFRACNISVPSLSLPDGLLTIGESSFAVVTFITNETPSIVVPASVESIGRDAFGGIRYMESKNGSLWRGCELTILGKNVLFPDEGFDVNMIHGLAGSTAAQFCSDHDIPFELIE